MIGYLIIAATLILFGAALGFILVVSLASHQDSNLTAPAPGRLTRGARTANGLHARNWEPLREEAAYRHDLPRPADREWR